jgi:hypothetical protein
LHYWKVSHTPLLRNSWKRPANGLVIRRRIGDEMSADPVSMRVFCWSTFYALQALAVTTVLIHKRMPKSFRTTGRHPDWMTDVVNSCGPLFCPWWHALPYGPLAPPPLVICNQCRLEGAGGWSMMQFAELANRSGQRRSLVEPSFLGACLAGEHRGTQQLCGTPFVVLRQLRCHTQ